MQFTLYSPVGFEPYDYRNPDNPGIGGSETAVREYAWRLAKRGHDVEVYTPLPEDTETPWRGSHWKNARGQVDYTKPGIWIMSRCPHELDKFPDQHPDQKLWIVSQDTDYPGQWTRERQDKVDRVIALCESHARALQMTYPHMEKKISMGFNGLRCDMLDEVNKEVGIPPRNPRRIIFASSPDRGLITLLRMFRRCRDWGSGEDGLGSMELWIGYGFDNIQKWVDAGTASWSLRQEAKEIIEESKQPGVTFLGRMGQRELYKRRLQCGLAVHPTMFTETGFISVLEEMAAGCIPILAPLWAAGEYGQHGVWIQGDPNDPLIFSRYVSAICNYARFPEAQTRVRTGMMAWAKARFNWEWMIDLIEIWAKEDYDPARKFVDFENFDKFLEAMPEDERKTLLLESKGQYEFQWNHSHGKILNLAAGDDGACLRLKGAINLDLFTDDPHCDRPNKIHIQGDIREIPVKRNHFDTVVLGEVLEHFETDDVPKVMRGAAECLVPGGLLVVTVPNDHRGEQGFKDGKPTHYSEGISMHHHPVGVEIIQKWCQEADCEILKIQPIDYRYFNGHGFVAKPRVKKNAVLSV